MAAAVKHRIKELNVIKHSVQLRILEDAITKHQKAELEEELFALTSTIKDLRQSLKSGAAPAKKPLAQTNSEAPLSKDIMIDSTPETQSSAPAPESSNQQIDEPTAGARQTGPGHRRSSVDLARMNNDLRELQVELPLCYLTSPMKGVCIESFACNCRRKC